MDGFRGACSEKNWLIAIARNTCRDMRRSAWFRHVDKVLVNMLFRADDTEHPYDAIAPWGYFVVMDARTGEVLRITKRTMNTDIRDIV